MLKKTTNKKFYGKWLYKVTLEVPGIAILRIKSLQGTIDLINNDFPSGKHPTYSIYYKVKSNQENVKKVCSFLLKENPEDWTKRIESNSIDIYTNNKELYSNLCLNLKSLVIHHFEPADSTLANESQYTIVANKLPHDIYKYKVYLRPHKLAKDKSAKKELIQWISAQGERILMSDAVKTWFIDTDWNWDRRYLFVDTEQTLLLLKMRNSDAVGKVYEYKIVDK